MEDRRAVVTWLFVGIALLFNPLAPVYLDRGTWRPLDIACGLAFLAVAAGLTATKVSNGSDWATPPPLST